MEKYRIAFTVQDYYDYIGTNPCYSLKKRMLESIPEQFRQSGYNIKFKTLRGWIRYYRVHMSVKMTEEEIRKKMQEGAAKLTPIVTEVSGLVVDAYQEGFKTCWELLRGQKLDKE